MTASSSLGRGGTSVETVRRLGQALWMSVGTSVHMQDLSWARGLLGADGPAELYRELEYYGALAGPAKVLSADGLARFLCSLLPDNGGDYEGPRLIWTLPPVLAAQDDEDAYCSAAVAVIDAARQTLWLVSPFLEARGIGRLLEALVRALARGVHVQVIAHGVGSVADRASGALEQLRREANVVRGKLTVYAVRPDAGLLVHSKLIVADETRATLGSANLTDRGLSTNFEAGVVLPGSAASEIARRILHLLGSGLVEKTYETQPG